MATSGNNEIKIARLRELIDETFARTLKKGFYGKVSFHASIQDGAIQEIEKQETEKYRTS